MRVIPPLTINDARLTSSTAAEPGAGETAWAAGTAYVVGQKAIRTTTHRVYERIVAGTTATAPENDLVNWQDAGPTNKMAMFDLLRNSATVLASPLTVVITPGKRIDSLALIGLDADQVVATMTVGASTVWSATEMLTLRRTTRWSEYFFGAFRYKNSIVKFNLPQVTGAVLTITITRTAGTVKCGGVILGQSVYLGKLQNEPRDDALNFSTVDRDAFGNATLVPRRTVPKLDGVVIAPAAITNKLREVRSDLNAVPALWSGLDDKTGHDYFEAALIFGVYKEFSLDLSNTGLTKVSLKTEEI